MQGSHRDGIRFRLAGCRTWPSPLRVFLTSHGCQTDVTTEQGPPLQKRQLKSQRVQAQGDRSSV